MKYQSKLLHPEQFHISYERRVPILNYWLAFICCCCFLFVTHISVAQFKQKADSFNVQISNAANDSLKIAALGHLAELYYTYQLDKQGDSVLQIQLNLASVSENKNLLLYVLFGHVIDNVTNAKNANSWRSRETLNKAIAFIEKGLEYARETNKDDYAAISYIRLSELYRSMGMLEKAYFNASIGYSTASASKNDTAIISAAIELGNVYLRRGEAVLAFKSFSNAYDIAVRHDYYLFQSKVFHSYAALYNSLGNGMQAKDYLHRSIELNRSHNNVEALVADYIEFGRISNERYYIDKAIALSDSLSNEKLLIQSKRLLYGYYAFVIANSDSTLNYINSNPDLKQVYFLGDSAKYYSIMGSIYHFAHRCDSAIYFMKLAESNFEKNYGVVSLQNLYAQLADCFSKTNQLQQSVLYYQKATALNNDIKDPTLEMNFITALGSLNERMGKYKEAFFYSRKSGELKDSLQKLSDNRNIVLMEVNNEKKEHDLQLEKIAKEHLVKINLQYMLITILISLIFVVMILTGMFPISKITIKILGYFSFISLFEFIILILDNIIHKWTHGEPLYIWLIKIFIIAILAPFHHYLEAATKRFIESRHLIRLRKKLTSIKWWPKKSKKLKSPAIGEAKADDVS